MNAVQVLRNFINSGKILVAPGVSDGLSALLAKQAGFPVLYASGGAIARSTGYPDIGLLSMTEVCASISHIVNVTGLPIIADADTGFGNALNVRRTVLEFERIGVAGLHLEDQTFPKRCGHLDDKTLVSTDEMCHKIRIARSSLSNPEFVLIARTDAIAVEGFDNAILRAKAYKKAGADMIFVEAPETIQQIEMIAKTIPGPKLINQFHGGKTPVVPLPKLQELGYCVVIIPSDLQRAAIKAMQTTLSAIQQNGNSEAVLDQLVTFNEREKIVGTAQYFAIDKLTKT
ncbi:MAG: isocitrate lyase [Gammaproteobacteria bacterium RIFCSPHIGHO2_12_FULL_38_11]|nr:MAG: isocitrate lyase [Gammaproteobacteria bacterium RIFCSPHIGHO2_12_FULL_38_11]